MRGGYRRHGHWIISFTLATSHVLVTGGIVKAGVESYLDSFDDRSYSSSDGTRVWSGPWEEVGETTDPLAGDWQVVEDVGFGRYALGKKGAEGLGVQRVADLGGFGSATLTFDHRRNFLPAEKSIVVQVSSTGTPGPWTTVHTISGSSPPVIDPAYIPVSVDISAFISSDTAIRFLHPSGFPSFGDPMTLFIDNVEIVGNVSNDAPVISAIGSLAGDEGAPIVFTATATDPNPGDELTFTLDGAVPEGASITSGGVFGWTPSEAHGPGTYTFDVVVTDDGTPSLSDTETIVLTVYEVNSAPELTAPGDQANGEGDSVSLFVPATDADFPATTLTWSATGLPLDLNIDSSTGEISGSIAHSSADASPYNVQVTVSDGDLEASATFQWTISDGNRSPVLAPIGDISGEEHTPIIFSASANDPDSDTLTYSMAGAVPEGATITSDGLFTWTPTETQGAGTYAFDVMVTDDGTPALADSETIALTVHEVNAAPVIVPPGDQSDDEGDPVSLAVPASDPESPAGALTWSATGLPPGLSINTWTGVISGTVSYSASATTPYSTWVTVTDGRLDATTSFAWTIGDTNRGPVLSDIPDLAGDEGAPISFEATASDPDGDALALYLVGAVPTGASITASGSFGWTPTESQGPGTYTFDVVATDSGTPALTDAETIEIEVREVNVAPVATADRYTVTRGGVLAIDSTGVLVNDNDPDLHELSAWLVAQPEMGSVELDADGSFVYTHSADGDADDSFTYRVFDGHGGHADAIVTIIVEGSSNRAPITGGDSIRVPEDTKVSIYALGNDSDPDGDRLTLVDVVLTHGGTVSVEGGLIRFVPNRDFHGTLRAAYTIEDEHGASAESEIVIEVTPVNDDPHAVADHVVLSRYLSQHIPVLSNDTDVDGDDLTVVAAGDPGRGESALVGDGITFTAPRGWTGTTSFTYVIADGSGGVAEGVVTVEVPRATLTAARQLSMLLGTDQLKSRWVESQFASKLDLAISPLMGLQLFVQAFFQSLDGIELSLALLGMTAVVLAGLSLGSRVPLVVPFGSSRYWSAVLVGRESQLEIREKPDRDSKVIYQLRPATKGIESEPARGLMPKGWKPVATPRGQGWAETLHLTEQVDAQSFIEDERPKAMVVKLAARLMRGQNISRLLGSRGLVVDLGEGLEVIAAGALTMPGGSGPAWSRRQPRFQRELVSRMVTPFLEAYRDSVEISAESSHSSSVLLPTEILNFRYLTVGTKRENSWLVLFEYQKGRPRIVGILRDE